MRKGYVAFLLSLFCLLAQPLLAYAASLPALIKQVSPSIVLIVCEDQEGNYVQGSGFFISQVGEIATNAHVVKNASRIVAIYRRQEHEATLVRSGADRGIDLALIKLNKLPSGVKKAIFAKSDPELGEDVFVLGYPKAFDLGIEPTLSVGKITSKRKIKSQALLQVSTPITHGSSGGPVFNMKGEVVGVATSTLGEADISFAIPSQYIKTLQKTKKDLVLKKENRPAVNNVNTNIKKDEEVLLSSVNEARSKLDSCNYRKAILIAEKELSRRPFFPDKASNEEKRTYFEIFKIIAISKYFIGDYAGALSSIEKATTLWDDDETKKYHALILFDTDKPFRMRHKGYAELRNIIFNNKKLVDHLIMQKYATGYKERIIIKEPVFDIAKMYEDFGSNLLETFFEYSGVEREKYVSCLLGSRDASVIKLFLVLQRENNPGAIAYAHWLLCRIYLKEGQYAQAKKECEILCTLDPTLARDAESMIKRQLASAN